MIQPPHKSTPLLPTHPSSTLQKSRSTTTTTEKTSASKPNPDHLKRKETSHALPRQQIRLEKVKKIANTVLSRCLANNKRPLTQKKLVNASF